MKLIYISLFLCCFVFLTCCNNEAVKPKIITPAETSSDINNVTVALPDAKGVDLVTTNCATCHSLRYIEMQPDMTKKGWDKIVKKMVKNYGAPISDTVVINQIIDYLATIKGKK